MLVPSLLLAPVLYFFWDRTPRSISHDVGEIFGLMIAVVAFYILRDILNISINVVDNAILGKIFSQNNSEKMWVIFRKIVYSFIFDFFSGIFAHFFDPAKYGPFSWIGCLSDLTDSVFCLGLVYLIALLFGVGVQLQSEIDEVI